MSDLETFQHFTMGLFWLAGLAVATSFIVGVTGFETVVVTLLLFTFTMAYIVYQQVVQ